MRRYSHVGVPHVTYGRPPTFDGDAQQEGDDQGSSASSSVVLAYITPYTVTYICYLIITPVTPRGGPGASSFTSRGGGSPMRGGAWSMAWTHSRVAPGPAMYTLTHVYTIPAVLTTYSRT